MQEHKPSTILVVEDEKVTRLVITNLLKREGFDVLSAEDGSEALRALKGQKVDLILSDIHMPIMDGFELFGKVQLDPNLRPLPFIFLTSLTGQEHLMLGKELGVDDYLMKPIDRDVLLASIRGKLKRAATVQATRTEAIEDVKRQVMKLLSEEVKGSMKDVKKISSLIEDEKVTITREHLENLAQSVRSGGDRLQRGLDDFIMSLRIDSGEAAQQFADEKSRQDLKAVLTDLVSRSSSYAKSKNVQVVWKAPDSLPSVVGVRKLLEHMVSRIVYGAVALSNPSSSVEVTAEVGTRELMLDVRDGGTGIGEDDVSHIFDKFPSVLRPDADQYPLGLSLFTAKRLAEISKCDLTCLSQPGRGTTFSLALPLS